MHIIRYHGLGNPPPRRLYPRNGSASANQMGFQAFVKHSTVPPLQMSWPDGSGVMRAATGPEKLRSGSHSDCCSIVVGAAPLGPDRSAIAWLPVLVRCKHRRAPVPSFLRRKHESCALRYCRCDPPFRPWPMASPGGCHGGVPLKASVTLLQVIFYKSTQIMPDKPSLIHLFYVQYFSEKIHILQIHSLNAS